MELAAVFGSNGFLWFVALFASGVGSVWRFTVLFWVNRSDFGCGLGDFGAV